MKTPPHDLVTNLTAIGDRILVGDELHRMEDVARAVGVSRASLYYWFSGQDDLVAFLLTSHAEQGAAAVEAAVDQAAAPSTRLRQMVAAMAGHLGARPGTCRGLLRAAGDANLADVLATNDRLVGAPLRQVLDDCRADGTLRAADVRVAADATVGALLMAVLGGAAAGTDTACDQFATAVTDQVLHGLVTGVTPHG